MMQTSCATSIADGESFDRKRRARFISVNPQIQRDCIIWHRRHSLEAGEVGQRSLAYLSKLRCSIAGGAACRVAKGRLDVLCCFFRAA